MTSGNIPTGAVAQRQIGDGAFRRAARYRGVAVYFRSLTTRSRYNRFLGAISEVPTEELDQFVHVGEANRFSVIAVMTIDGAETIVGEARYAFDPETDSRIRPVDRRPLAGPRLGAALLQSGMPRRLVRRRQAVRRYPALQRSHVGLARKSGFAFTNRPATGSWCGSKSTSRSRRGKFPAPAGGSRRK